eukprot:9672514-Heterocapsa_arctica.AAC.1
MASSVSSALGSGTALCGTKFLIFSCSGVKSYGFGAFRPVTSWTIGSPSSVIFTGRCVAIWAS